MKEKTEKRTYILTTLVCLIPLLVGAILYPSLPETVVTHWDANGVPNGTQSKFIGIIVFPGSLVILNLLLPFIMKTDPKYSNIDTKMKTLVQWSIPIIAMFASGVTFSAALGKELPVPMIGTMLVGAIMVAIGNYLPKTSQSYTVGIKLPWTLHSEENWNRTHRMAGFLWVIGGLCILIGGLLDLSSIILPAAMVVMVPVPTVYSYMLYRKGI